MATTLKVLGQNAPGASSEQILYTVPASTETVVSTFVACNRGTTTAKIRMGVSVNGGALANQDYVYYDLPLPPNDTFAATVGISMDASDEIRVFADTANVTFSAFGQEKT